MRQAGEEGWNVVARGSEGGSKGRDSEGGGSDDVRELDGGREGRRVEDIVEEGNERGRDETREKEEGASEEGREKRSEGNEQGRSDGDEQGRSGGRRKGNFNLGCILRRTLSRATF